MNGALSPEEQGLKLAGKALVAAVGGGDAASGFCRVRQQGLSEQTSINDSHKWLAVDTVMKLEAITSGQSGHPHVTRYMAARQGFALVALPSPRAVPLTPLQLIEAISKESGEVVSNLARHAEGGLTASEVQAAQLVREFDELIRIGVEGKAAMLAILNQ